MPPDSSSQFQPAIQDASRSKKLQLLGILSGFAAGAWLGAAEAPTKLVSIGISPMVISLIMVIGVFLARWSLPALILGTSSVRADVRRAPHLVIWAPPFLCGTRTAFSAFFGVFFSSMSCTRQVGAVAPVFWAARLLCVSAPRSWPSPPRQGKAQPHILYTGSGPPSVPEFFGAPCTFPIAKPT